MSTGTDGDTGERPQYRTTPPSGLRPLRSFPTACVILAAGAGTRFGEPKAGATLRPGVRFVDAVIETARAAGANPIVVVAPPALMLPDGVEVVVNPEAAGEQIVSVRLGLAQLTSRSVSGALIWPVDHPYVQVTSALAVLDAAQRTRALIALPVFQGRRGHPVYFSRDIWRELATVSDGGARAVVQARAGDVREVQVSDPGVLRDVDTRKDLLLS